MNAWIDVSEKETVNIHFGQIKHSSQPSKSFNCNFDCNQHSYFYETDDQH
jgi:hypothetical protein